MSPIVVFVSCLLLVIVSGNTYQQCSVRPLRRHPEAEARFSVIMSLRNSSEKGECTTIKDSALMMVVAIDWVVARLNNASLVPGVKYGYDLYDDCGVDLYSTASALDAISYYFPTDLRSCMGNGSTYYLGILGPTRSQTAEQVLNIVKGSDIPVVSPTATSPDLRESPNFFRAVPSDDDQVNVFIDLIERNKWNYVVAMYTDDKYGQNGVAKLVERAKLKNICVRVIPGFKTTEVFNNSYRDEIVTALLSHIDNTTDKSLGVVYFGQNDVIQRLLIKLNLASQVNGKLRKIKWIMSESVGKRVTVFKNAEDVSNEALTISVATHQVQEVEAHFDNIRTSSDDIANLVRNHRRQSSNDWVNSLSSFIDATFALAMSLKTIFYIKCRDTKVICDGFMSFYRKTNKLEFMSNTTVDYQTLGTDVAPSVFYNQHRKVKFDVFGDLVPNNSSALYKINMFKQKTIIEIGNYTNGVLIVEQQYQNSTSTCQKGCELCEQTPDIHFEFIEGDVYIIGLFSLHRTGDDPLNCGEFRNLTFDVLSVEAFLNSINEAQKETGVRYGGIAFDDCYSSTRASMIITDIFSGKLKIPSAQNAIDPAKIVGVIGPFPSGVTVPITFVFTGLGLPSISYASTSPDLDDKVINYPYFLRTVPSDVDQANAMVKILIKMGMDSTGLVYVDSNYGSKGKDAFKIAAKTSGVCITREIRVSVDDKRHENFQVKKDLESAVAGGTNLFVYFGTEGRMVDVLSYLNHSTNSGIVKNLVFIGSDDWADGRNIKNMFGSMIEGTVSFKIRTRKTNTNFINNLIQKTSSIKTASHWYKIFYRHYNKCFFEGDFVKTYSKKCSTDITFRDTDGILSDGRISHTILAVKALTKGIAEAKKQFCSGEPFPCVQYQINLDHVSSTISNVTIFDDNRVSFQVFDGNRNGNVGFQLLQIRKDGEGYIYSEVGSYDDGNLVLKSDLMQSVQVSTASCATSKPSEAKQNSSSESTEFRLPEIIIIVLGSLCIILIIVVVAVITSSNRKLSGLYKSLEETKHKLTIYNEIGSAKRHKQKHASKKNGDPVVPAQNGFLVEAPGHHYLPLQDPDHGHRYDGQNIDLHNQTSPKQIAFTEEPRSLSTSAQRPDLPPRNVVEKRLASKSESDIHNSFPFIKPKMENYKIRMGTAMQTTPTDSLHSLHSQGSVFGSQYPKSHVPSTPEEETTKFVEPNGSSPSKSLPSSPRSDQNYSYSQQEARPPSQCSPLSHKGSIHSQFSGDTLHITGNMKSPQQKVKRLKSFSSEEPQKISRV